MMQGVDEQREQGQSKGMANPLDLEEEFQPFAFNAGAHRRMLAVDEQRERYA
jgi:hypothetical protein